jgi:hypothetical protein
VLEAAGDVYGQMKPSWKGSTETLLRKVVGLVERLLQSNRIEIVPASSGSQVSLAICLETLWSKRERLDRVIVVQSAIGTASKGRCSDGFLWNASRRVLEDRAGRWIQPARARALWWDYQAGTYRTPVTPYDVFCAGQTVLPDGKVLVAGGTQQYDPFIGMRSSWIFDPTLEEWIRVGDMTWGRWYPSLVTLGDGCAIAVSGINQASEIYSPSAGWSTLPHGTDLPLYPHLFVLADGQLFFTGGQLGTAVIDARKIDPLTAGETVVPGLRSQGNRDEAFSVLLPPAQDQKIMVFGGGGPAHATKRTDIVDLKAGAPHYVPGPDMAHARGLHTCVILPDRKVLVSGGGYRGETRSDAVHQAELYDTATSSFDSAGTQLVSRLYHSIALLLPDGRVITAGSNPDRGDDELRLELYHPPYLFRGPRPFIQACTHEWSYGTQVPIHTPQAGQIRWAHLIRPMAVTHSDDTSQRLVDLPIEHRDVCHLQVSVTHSSNLAPPGWYLLFLCDNEGVPSVAEWIHLDRKGVVRPVLLNEKMLRPHMGHAHEHVPGFPIPGFPTTRHD